MLRRGSILQRQLGHVRCHALKSSASMGKVAPSFLSIKSVEELSSKYQGVLLDQFGVLHDGR